MPNPIKHRHDGLQLVPAGNYYVRVRDVFILDYLYTMIHDWMVHEGWAPEDDAQFNETYYMQRDSPKHGKEIWVRWRLNKQPPGTKSKVFMWLMDIQFKIIGMKPTEIVHKNQKIKMDRGEFEFEVFAFVALDYGKEWEKSVLKRMKTLVLKRMYRHKIGKMKKEVHAEAYRLRELVMSYMKLENILPEKEAGEYYARRNLE